MPTNNASVLAALLLASLTVLASDTQAADHSQLKYEQAASPQKNSARQARTIASLFSAPPAHSDFIYGDKNATISMITYMDFDCPYCRKIRPILKRAVNDSSGDTNWVFRHFPLNTSKPSDVSQAAAAQCAGELLGNNEFWRFSDALLSLSRRNQPDDRSLITRAATSANVDLSALERCITDNTIGELIHSHKSQAQAMGIKATPSILLFHKPSNTTNLIEGFISTSALQEKLNQFRKNQ